MPSQNPFVYNNPWLVYPYAAGQTPRYVQQFVMFIGICSEGAIVGETGLTFNGLGEVIEDYQTGTFHQIGVPVHWTGTCYAGFRSYYYDPETGAIVNSSGFFDSNNNFIGPIKGRNTLFKDIPNLQHLSIGININFDGPFPICAVRLTEFTERFSSVVNSSGVCFPSWAVVEQSTVYVPPDNYSVPTGLPPTILPPSGPRPPLYWNKFNFGAYCGAIYKDTVIYESNPVWNGKWTLGTKSFYQWDVVPWYYPEIELVNVEDPAVDPSGTLNEVGVNPVFNPLNHTWWWPQQLSSQIVAFVPEVLYSASLQKLLQQYQIVYAHYAYIQPTVILPPFGFDDLKNGPQPNDYTHMHYIASPFLYGGFVEIDLPLDSVYSLAALEAGATGFGGDGFGGPMAYANRTLDEIGIQPTIDHPSGLLGYFAYNQVPMEPAGYNLYVYGLASDGNYYIAPNYITS